MRYSVGIVGGGQLARMMHQAAISLGIDVRLLAEGEGVSAAQVIPDAFVGDYTDHDVSRAKLIRDLVTSGVPTRLVAIVLEQRDDREGTWTNKCDRDFAARLVDEIEDLDGRIACLTRSRDALGELLHLPLTQAGSREASV